MAMMAINLDPTQRQLKQFGWMLLAFFGALGGLLWWRPEALVVAAGILTLAVLVSVIFNRDMPWPTQLWGLLMPAIFGLVGQLVVSGVRPSQVAGGLWIVGGVLSGVVIVSPRICRKLYIGWISAAQPIGWTISHLVLAVVFYLVITPLGLAMRCLGRDPMQRKLDRQAATYWQPRKPVADVKRYYRQF